MDYAKTDKQVGAHRDKVLLLSRQNEPGMSDEDEHRSDQAEQCRCESGASASIPGRQCYRRGKEDEDASVERLAKHDAEHACGENSNNRDNVASRFLGKSAPSVDQ
jgi:hypothetical protein